MPCHPSVIAIRRQRRAHKRCAVQHAAGSRPINLQHNPGTPETRAISQHLRQVEQQLRHFEGSHAAGLLTQPVVEAVRILVNAIESAHNPQVSPTLLSAQPIHAPIPLRTFLPVPILLQPPFQLPTPQPTPERVTQRGRRPIAPQVASVQQTTDDVPMRDPTPDDCTSRSEFDTYMRPATPLSMQGAPSFNQDAAQQLARVKEAAQQMYLSMDHLVHVVDLAISS